MFVGQAHSFRQQSRLAITLATVAGYTNIITLLTCHTVTSHMSGITSSLGRDLATGSWGMAAFGLFLLATFFVGAGISGFCTEFGHRRGWQSIYVLPMIVEVMLLASFALLLEFAGRPAESWNLPLFAMTGLAAMAMGLQNATITRISGGVIRTTHVTGVLTDFGQETMQLLFWLRDRRRNVPPGPARALIHSVFTHPPARHVALLASILAAFALGAGMGTVIYEHVPRLAMFLPVAFLIWIVYQDLVVPIAEIEPFSLVGAGSSFDLPSALAVFHLRKDHDRKGRVHRMPNLLEWSERLPPAIRVIVLDLGEVTQLNANAVLELRALLAHFKEQGRQLIVAGMNAQFREMQLSSEQELLPLENICLDLELAIARGLNLLASGGSGSLGVIGG